MPERQDKYYLYQVPTNTTLTALVNEKDSVFKVYKNKKSDLLKVTYNGQSNSQRIYDKYTGYQRATYFIESVNFSLDIVNAGTELVVPENKVPIDLFSIAGKGVFLEQKNMQAFLVDAYKTINNDPNNVPTTIIETGLDVAQLKTNYVSVWIYCRALGKIIDVTKFLSNLNTSSNMSSGGSFSMSLEGITDINMSFSQGEDLVNFYNVEPSYNRDLHISYWAKWLQQKDIVWIRWEKLELEKTRDTLINKFEVDKSKLVNQVYDMIGLIENVNENSNFSSLDRSVSVSGKDLTFLLSEDAAYFYPLLFAAGSDAIMINTSDDSKLLKRNIFKDGIFEEFFTFMERSVSDSIGFVINQLSNLGIVDNDLFSSYDPDALDKGARLGKRRDKKQTFSFKGTGKEDSAYVKWQDVEGIWQIIDVFVDERLEKRRQVDSLLQTSQGSILSMMNSICQDPFVEFTGDTFGDKYVFFARQKLWTKTAIQGFLRDNMVIEIDGKDVLSQNLDWETEYFTSYEIQPNSSFLGYDKFTAISYIPVVFLSKIGEVFGNKPYTQTDSYIDERALAGDKLGNIDSFQSAVIDDLGYLIEINSYLPFTRKGTITINGDRRIKKGTWVYHKITNEIFYVDSVSHTGSWSANSVDRTTTLNVQRGMIRDYVFQKKIKNTKGELVTVSYFDIVDTETVKRVMKQTLIDSVVAKEEDLKNGDKVVTYSVKETAKANFDVNLDVFDFFLKRGQLLDISEGVMLFLK
jgi:hypothetical protein